MPPLIVVEEDTLPRAWEKAVALCWERGTVVETEWGEKARHCTAVIMVRDPLAEPRIHKYDYMVGRCKLFEYVAEVVGGVHDEYVEEGRWSYTYHQRLRCYPSSCIDQIEYIVKKLREAPYTRRAQAITWYPPADMNLDDVPCLQRIWVQIEGGRLNMHVHMRSNDAYKAAFANMFAFTALQRYIAARLGVEVGYYLHIVDDFHIYERDWRYMNGFTRRLGNPRNYFTTKQYFDWCIDVAIKMFTG